MRIPSTDITLNNGSTNANTYIRGIGTKGVGVNAVSAVGVYADEVSLNSPIVNVLQLVDLERVEVLRGPQNTLYGRNTTDGVVNYISARPQLGGGFSGKASVTLVSHAQRDLEAALGTDLGTGSAVRLAVLAQRRDGVYDDVNLRGKVYDRQSTAARLQWLWQPAKSTSVLVKLHGEEVDQTNKLWKMIGLGPHAGPDWRPPDGRIDVRRQLLTTAPWHAEGRGSRFNYSYARPPSCCAHEQDRCKSPDHPEAVHACRG